MKWKFLRTQEKLIGEIEPGVYIIACLKNIHIKNHGEVEWAELFVRGLAYDISHNLPDGASSLVLIKRALLLGVCEMCKDALFHAGVSTAVWRQIYAQAK